MVTIELLNGDCRNVLKTLPPESVHCCVTSPPYWGLRNYAHLDQIGMEDTPQEYVNKMVDVFREVKRVLRADGTLWLNLGHTYSSGRKTQVRQTLHDAASGKQQNLNGVAALTATPPGMKPKDLVPIPWMVAMALQADGWYLRCDIIWSKPNAMPSSVRDRPTISHEYIFLLTKSAKYYYDADAIAEPAKEHSGQAATFARDNGKALSNVPPGQSRAQHRPNRKGHLMKTLSETQTNIRAARDKQRGYGNPTYDGFNARWKARIEAMPKRNKRSVWTVPTASYSGAHFAVFPPNLIRPCILAGCPVDGIVLDPFGGSGTTGKVAIECGRSAVLVEVNPDYIKQQKRRTSVQIRLAGMI